MARQAGPLGKVRTSAVIMAAALLISGEARAESSGAGFSNFLDNIFTGSLSKGTQAPPFGQRPGTAAQAQAAPATGGAAPPWSGEDGASGHPLMTASAIREATANFDSCVASMWPDAARRNISQQS